jgi:transcriptional regulator with XRE-family HTH domain
MVERILELLKDKKMTPSQFADEIGIQRSGMSHLISGRNKPSLEFIMKVLQRFPDVKPEYLLYGTIDQAMKRPFESEPEKEIELKTPATLFDQQPEIADNKPVLRPQRQVKREKTERRVEKIVVFYDDRTFREYEPEKGSDLF